jgi:hypothetical protein
MNDPIEELFKKYPADIQTIGRKLRSAVKSTMPEAYESIYHGALSYSLSPSVFERLVYLVFEKGYIRLGFNFGGYLPDPTHLLQGEGKRLRHVKFPSLGQASQPELQHLVQAAWDNGPQNVAQMKNDLLKSRPPSDIPPASKKSH